VYTLVEDPPYLTRLKNGLRNFDYIGFALLMIGVGALQVALDKGQEDDWFGSHFITTLIVFAAIGLISLVIWEWFQKEPIVDVRLFRRFNFATTNLMFFVLGMILFSSTVLMPQFLQTLMGYSAEAAGMVLSVAALLLLCVLPIIGRLTARFQARHLLAFGWITLAVGMYISCRRLDLLISFRAATWLRVLQYLPVGFLFVPLTLAGYVGLPKEKTNAAAGLMNFMCNIGQSVGTSAVTTLLARRSQYHQSVLAEYTHSGRFQSAVGALTLRLSHAGLSVPDARHQALGRLYGMVQSQAATLSYVDVYWLLSVASSIMFLLSFVLKKNEPGAGNSAPNQPADCEVLHAPPRRNRVTLCFGLLSAEQSFGQATTVIPQGGRWARRPSYLPDPRAPGSRRSSHESRAVVWYPRKTISVHRRQIARRIPLPR
jgi:DHA2 family multidrug resistance protein